MRAQEGYEPDVPKRKWLAILLSILSALGTIGLLVLMVWLFNVAPVYIREYVIFATALMVVILIIATTFYYEVFGG